MPAVIFGEKKLERQLSYGMYTETLLCRGRVTDAIEAVSVYVYESSSGSNEVDC